MGKEIKLQRSRECIKCEKYFNCPGTEKLPCIFFKDRVEDEKEKRHDRDKSDE